MLLVMILLYVISCITSVKDTTLKQIATPYADNLYDFLLYYPAKDTA